MAAILNSTQVNEAIKPFQTMGLLGERDIEKKVLDLPIPIFNRKDKAHTHLAALGARASTEAAAYVEANSDLPALGRARAAVRDALSSTMSDIDKAVAAIVLQ